MYKIELEKAFLRSLKKLPKDVQQIVANVIDTLAKNPRGPNTKKLVGKGNLYRVRIGNYRLVYAINDRELILIFVRIGHRKEVYDHLH